MVFEKNKISENMKNILVSMGEDPKREGLLRTPERYANFLEEFLNPKKFELTSFSSESYDEMIVQTNISFFSLCEHHLLPFFGNGVIAYIPNDKIVGLSKLSRTLEHFSRKLQTQERITSQVAHFLQEHLNPKGVAVLLKARHMCMEMRGIQKSGVETTTSCLIGVFKENSLCRNEFLELTK